MAATATSQLFAFRHFAFPHSRILTLYTTPQTRSFPIMNITKGNLLRMPLLIVITVQTFLTTHSIYCYCSSGSFSEQNPCSLPICLHCSSTKNLSDCILIQLLQTSEWNPQFILLQLFPWFFRNKESKMCHHGFLREGHIHSCQQASLASRSRRNG